MVGAPKSGDGLSDPTFLREQAPLLAGGEFELDSELSYARNEVGQTRESIGAFALTLRAAATTGLEFFATMPVVFGQRQVLFASAKSSTETVELGDLRLGVKYALLTEGATRPALVLSASVGAPTGPDPYRRPSGITQTDPNVDIPNTFSDTRNPFEIQVGTGHWSVAGGITLIKTFDPIIVYGGIDYTHSFPDEFFGTRVEPGDRYGFFTGLGFGVSPISTIGLQVSGRIERPWRFDDVEITSSERVPLNLRISYTHRLESGSSIEPSVNFGIAGSEGATLNLAFTQKF